MPSVQNLFLFSLPLSSSLDLPGRESQLEEPPAQQVVLTWH
jgi:hypothetical protein